MKVPLITLRRGPFSVLDILWAVPVVFHLTFVVSRPWAVEAIGNVYEPFKSWSVANQNFAWNFFVQFLFVSMVGGDCFNPMGHLSRWDLGTNRLSKVITALLGPVCFALLVSSLLSDDLSKKVANALPHAKLCDTEHCVKQTCSCTMKLCSIHDALLGHCTSGRAQGCCVTVRHFILDEARHSFIFALTMRTLGPYLAPSLLLPLAAATFQMGTRMLPTTLTGGMFNPTPALARAVLTGDYSVAPLAVVATLLGAACSNAVYLFASAVLRGVEPSTLASVILAGAGSAAGHVLSDSDPAFSAIGAVLGAVLGFGLFAKAAAPAPAAKAKAEPASKSSAATVVKGGADLKPDLVSVKQRKGKGADKDK